ncbi:MAG TPA: S8/S53 family peptidase [Anaerolineales bacterium]|nr:S8/S53 family peptidase [Anaerolineales bacterium]
MSKLYRTIALFVIAAFITSCGGPGTLPEVSIVRHPEPANYSGFNVYTELPTFDPASTDPFQVDLRSADLAKLDLSTSKDSLIYAAFDSKTQWPTSEKMPADFDSQKIMEIGTDPGLEMRALHDQGITAQGVGIAIIDQTLLVDHIEYKDRIVLYEEAEDITDGWMDAQMHGPAVASIAVGKTVGVAPKADLYFIATAMCSQGTYESVDFACLAKSVRRIIEINEGLPSTRKIRVLSMSIGWGPQSKGYDEISAAVNEAKAAGIFVISSSLSETHGLHFHGLGRDPLADPNTFQSYAPGLWWQQWFFDHGFSSDVLMVPMDSRTTASPTRTEDYVFYRQGGWSWSIPYLAGMYALAVQVKPDITPEEFWATALETGQTIQIQHDGKNYEFGVILDPQALIEAIKTR